LKRTFEIADALFRISSIWRKTVIQPVLGQKDSNAKYIAARDLKDCLPNLPLKGKAKKKKSTQCIESTYCRYTALNNLLGKAR
jgi:hypothetical protein